MLIERTGTGTPPLSTIVDATSAGLRTSNAEKSASTKLGRLGSMYMATTGHERVTCSGNNAICYSEYGEFMNLPPFALR